MNAAKQPWIHSATFDSLFLLAPPLLTTLVVALCSRFFETRVVSLGWWIALVLCVDVAHVYASIYRSYLHPKAFLLRRQLFLAVPLACWAGGVMLYSVRASFFWTALAYLAVFHFVRQQYGFLRLYSRNQKTSLLDQSVIYLATLYPLGFWHAHLPRNFHWFLEGDFLTGFPVWLASFLGWALMATILAYLFQEIRAWRTEGYINIPKQMVVSGTVLSWYCGIVWLNGDLSFTFTNVLAHGIPYLALVWSVGSREQAQMHRSSKKKMRNFSPFRFLYTCRAIPLYLGILLFLAYLEEGLWGGMIWRERLDIFPLFRDLPSVRDSFLLSLLVPLLAVPQSTHYVLDAFLWRSRNLFSSKEDS